ncbi:Cytochrome b561 [Trichuris trichiura]|uniref:Cytochrome b561 n=1 Tax=Trichuris trichiura TaxID=36087 RepID=A0A077ZAD5_TRITR|nr:Cytochrome b561 [Trichuris trichiura]
MASLVTPTLDSNSPELRRFRFGCTVAHMLGITAVILVSVWMGSYGVGFEWEGSPAGMFRYHPMLMIIGMQLLMGEAALTYRMLRYTRKSISKPIHIALHSITFLCFVLALKAVFYSHNYVVPPIPNLYSLHSWVGLVIVLAFCLQYVFSFYSFFYPKVDPSLGERVMPIHRLIGKALLVASTASALMGISEYAAWNVKCWSQLCSEGMIANFTGLLLALYSAMVLYLVSNENYKREPLPEEATFRDLVSH